MDDFSNLITNLGEQLTALLAQNTVSSINTKIRSIRANRELDDARREYEEIINELIKEKDDAIRIALTYRDELERLIISDEDISYLHESISNALDLINSFSPPEKKIPQNQIEAIKGLISKNTLKSMQLLGFNYRKAIGEPLTNGCASFIENYLFNKGLDTKKKDNKRKIIK